MSELRLRVVFEVVADGSDPWRCSSKCPHLSGAGWKHEGFRCNAFGGNGEGRRLRDQYGRAYRSGACLEGAKPEEVTKIVGEHSEET